MAKTIKKNNKTKNKDRRETIKENEKVTSITYTDGISVNDLAEKYNFIFVLVTHDRDIMSLSDRTYEVIKGEVRLINEF